MVKHGCFKMVLTIATNNDGNFHLRLFDEYCFLIHGQQWSLVDRDYLLVPRPAGSCGGDWARGI